ncbi:zinc-dependent alcohol dehydrogenase family protein [Micromonospora purpureochromogenes]|uniref:Threonine dehydrogenase-like Zn-dependent dehydrogenase n=1 Tax=Micromonospora purpureochromogenes TaxID=47872 RepID=A0ABX2RQL3_9ACTN|nr:zinc-dependent alcohol dehydrogenase family protein [Micromonospora purpureochromogenes]NYF58820.1 threonine dehydrogenase-like Zn-dependent dehydrogenase [Micromonospora purpureochromogenes]
MADSVAEPRAGGGSAGRRLRGPVAPSQWTVGRSFHGSGTRMLRLSTRGSAPRYVQSKEKHPMRGVIMYAPGDVRVEEREDPKIIEPTDAIIRVTASCICGSDLWPYRGIEAVDHQVMGHEYVGVVEEIGSEVKNLKVGDFVVGSFVISDNTCDICRSGYQSKCVHGTFVSTIGTQSEKARIPLADGTLVPTPEQPDPELIPSLLAASDVLGTGWFGAVAAEAGPGKTVAVVGDGAVGLMAVLAAKQLGAERIIAMSRHPDRQELARFYGATDIVEERGDEGVAKIKELTNGLGAHSVIEAVGTQESMTQAIRSTRPGGHLGFVGVTHGVELPGLELFFADIHLHGGPAPVRRFLPDLIQMIWDRKIDPGKVFDLTLPLDQAAEGYTAMDERRAIKVLLTA